MTMLWKLCRSSSTSHFKVEASFDTGSLSSFAVPTNRSPGSERESSFLKLEHAKQERSKSRAEERSFLFVEPESEEGKEKTFFLLRRKDGAQSSANTMPESWTRPSAPRSVSDPTVPPTMTGPPPAPVHPSPTKASTMSHHPAAITAPVYRGSLSAHMTPDDWYQEALAALRIAEEWEWPNPPSRSPESMSTSSSEETLGPVTPKSAEMILHGEAEYEEARKRRTTRRFEDL
jgi:hypothetical protein